MIKALCKLDDFGDAMLSVKGVLHAFNKLWSYLSSDLKERTFHSFFQVPCN